jgi:methyl-accepting chemotaxis protein
VNNLVNDFSVTSEELFASIQEVLRTIEQVTISSNEGAEGTTMIASKADGINNKSSDIIEETAKSKDTAKKLREQIERFKI